MTADNQSNPHAALTDAAPQAALEQPASAPVQVNDIPEAGNGEAPAETALKKEVRDDRPPLAREPYDWEQCTITVVLQFMPLDDGQDKNKRLVVVSARDHLNTPIVQAAQASALRNLPPAVLDVMSQLKADLPNRERAYQESLEKQRAEEEEHKARRAQKRKPKKAKPKSKAWDAVPDGGKSGKPPAPPKTFTAPSPEQKQPDPAEQPGQTQMGLF